MKRVALALLAVGTFVLLCTAAGAVNWNDYPEFRGVSGLPGNGFSVLPDGKLGPGGAFFMNIPCAYTPCENNYEASFYCASLNHNLQFTPTGSEAHKIVNLGVGLGSPNHGIYLTQASVQFPLSVKEISLQWQVHPETKEWPAIAVGCFDLFNERQGENAAPHGARSFYAVATRKVMEGDQPLYASLGFGNHRFGDRPFAGVTWYATPRFNVGMEYDGLVPRPFVGWSAAASKTWDLNLGLGWSNFERPVIGGAVTYSR